MSRSVAMFFVLERRRGPDWDPSQPLEGQSGWDEHADYMDGLVDSGFVVLGGPLADEHRVILAIEAASEDEVRSTLARDPWHESHLVVESVDPWTIRLDGRSR
ncbi:MAG TPA: YciI family protein [Gaiellales bacterium]|nr:YciI family protein [Gaiellales bacterium]